MDFFKYSFLGDEWNVYLIEDDDNVITEENAAALTKFEERELYFRKSHYNLITVKHEIGHVYFSSLYLEDTNSIPIADIEEIVCTLISYKAEQIVSDAIKVKEKLDELKRKCLA